MNTVAGADWAWAAAGAKGENGQRETRATVEGESFFGSVLRGLMLKVGCGGGGKQDDGGGARTRQDLNGPYQPAVWGSRDLTGTEISSGPGRPAASGVGSDFGWRS